jgi:tryptophan synthase alpha chain
VSGEFEKQLIERVRNGEKLLVPYLTAGLPSPQKFIELVSLLAPFVSAIEVGIPFSDPIMDGPIIQEASMRALDAGVTVESSLTLVKETLRYVDVSLLVMTYYNPIHRMGAEKFVARIHAAGVAGVIIPDLPYEESEEVHGFLKKKRVALVQMVSPTTSDKRAAMLSGASEGFVYAVSRLGVTGERESLAETSEEVITRIRPHTKIPVLLGIGVTDAEQAAEACRYADGVIVGSAIMKRVLANDVREVAKLAREISTALETD